MESVDRRYKTQTFVCTNERPAGEACCYKNNGFEFFSKLKERLIKERLYTQHLATRSGCLGYCNEVGTTLVIHRDGQPSQWYTQVTDSDFETIWNKITSG